MTIFDFDSYRDYLSWRLKNPRKSEPARGEKTTLAGFARRLGYRSPSLISMILKGTRIPSADFCNSLSRHWRFSEREKKYFSLLVELEKRKRNGRDTSVVYDELREFSRRRTTKVLSESDFALAGKWYSLVLQELVSQPNFIEDYELISRRLRRKVSADQIRDAIQTMLGIGVLQREDATGRLQRANQIQVTSHDTPSIDIRNLHRDMLQRALEALHELPVNERLFNSLTISIDPARTQELRTEIWDFVCHVNTKYSAESTNSVYQLNIQFFHHTGLEDGTKQKGNA
jgi:uncharacterized protein (TIGR02147 family)